MKKRSKSGRPSSLTREVQSKICEALLAGTTRDAAARCGGICIATFKLWMKKGRESRTGKYSDFSAAVEAAESECQRDFEDVIRKAAQGVEEVTTKEIAGKDKDGNPFVRRETTKRTVYSFQAAAWWLERRRRKDYHPNHDRLIKEAVEKFIRQAIEDGTLAIAGGDSPGSEAANRPAALPKRREPDPDGDSK